MLYNSSNAISDLLKLAEGKKGKNEMLQIGKVLEKKGKIKF